MASLPIRLGGVFIVGLMVSILLSGSALRPARAGTPNLDASGEWLESGKALYRKGDMPKAAEALSAALNALPPADPESFRARRLLAAAHEAHGFFRAALAVLGEGLPDLDRSAVDPATRAAYLSQMGNLHLSLGRTSESLATLERAEDLATTAGDRAALAGVLNNRGNALELAGERPDALAAYREGIDILDGRDTAEAARVRVRLMLNLARFYLEAGDPTEARSLLTSAMTALERPPGDHDAGAALTTVGALSLEAAEKSGTQRAEDLQRAFSAFRKAREIGRGLDDPGLTASAAGRLGGMYWDEGRPEEAMALTREAVFLARQGRFPEELYRWQWQLGRFHDARGDADAAMAFLSRAVETLAPIRGELMRDPRRRGEVFYTRVRPVYLDLARLLLTSAEESPPGPERQERLLAAREVMETLKTAELEDFFQDPCVTAQAGQRQRLDRTPAGTAVVYPIVFADRIALLLTLPDGMRMETTFIDESRLEGAARRFRRLLQSPETGRRYFYYARRLHDWLMAPLAGALRENDVRTLVVAPDGVLRLIPFSALHDGDRFLSQTYGVATVPGVTLTDPEKTRLSDPRVLLAGLSEAREGFMPLPAVPEELRSIQSLMGGRVLLNGDYTLDNLKDAFQGTDYAVIHLATHGEFGGSSDATFLLTAEGRLTMDRLERFIHLGRFRENPVELLTLSACQTALGDARSALGLAGVAVKAGARSAVATLWSVDDEATALAVRFFYTALRKPEAGKAEALQSAQARLLADATFHHPAYWAPFLLIGNWR
jgi:CHAT domain-containing protein